MTASNLRLRSARREVSVCWWAMTGPIEMAAAMTSLMSERMVCGAVVDLLHFAEWLERIFGSMMWFGRLMGSVKLKVLRTGALLKYQQENCWEWSVMTKI